MDDDDVDQLMNLTTNLLRIALNDPGFPNPRKVEKTEFLRECTFCIMVLLWCNEEFVFTFLSQAVTTTGEKIMDVELTDHNCSEVLRIFMKARNNKEDEVTFLEHFLQG